ncbi:hypothetical protein [Ekhidna sp.]|uniref:hypothetical protein n=1 Tax=Ekhidna sp. TaxID=2608089 RepID=UPI003CCC0A99
MKDVIKYGLPWILLCAIIITLNQLGLNQGGRLIGLMIAILAIFYFNIDNPHKAYKNGLNISLIAWVVTLQLRQIFKPELGNWLPALAAAVLAFIYFQRFQARTDKHWVDALKLIGVLALLPATYFEPALTGIITTLLAFIYLLDRLIIRRQMNKTTQIITFCVMGLICLSFMIFAFIKADEAEKQRLKALAAQEEAERLRDEAVQIQQKAQLEAAQQASIAASIMEELQACKEDSKLN